MTTTTIIAAMLPIKEVTLESPPLAVALLGDPVAASLGDPVAALLGDSVAASLDDSVAASLGDPVVAPLDPSVAIVVCVAACRQKKVQQEVYNQNKLIH